MGFDSFAWLPICAGATGLGLVFSFLLLRRKGAAAGIRMAAWSLLPLAALMTGALSALWTIGSTVVGFVTSLVFNPVVWAGVALAGLSVVLFMASGVLRARKLARADTSESPQAQVPQKKQQPAQTKPAPGKPAVAAPPAGKKDDDFGDVEDILKRHGIS